MPKAPIAPELLPFVHAPRPAVVGTIRPDGSPSTTATWYGWSGDRLVLSMVASGPRARNVRRDPRVSLTILGASWYDHVSLLGEVNEIRDDSELVDLDELSQRYWGNPYPQRDLRCITVLVEVRRWHAWGDPGGTAEAEGNP